VLSRHGALALCTHEGARAPQTGHFSEGGHLRDDQPQRPVAFVPDPGYSYRYDQPMAQGTGSSICQRAVGEYLSASGGSITELRFGTLCEPPRADPHAGWCGEGEFKAPLYPIGSFYGGVIHD